MAKPAHLGASEPLHVFHDEFFNHPDPAASRAPMPPPTKQQREPLQASRINAMLKSSSPSSVKQPSLKPSPLKPSPPAAALPSTPLRQQSRGKRLSMVPMIPPANPPRSTDSLEKKQPPMSRFKTAAKNPPCDAGALPRAREKMHQPIFPAPLAANIPLDPYGTKPPSKRTLMGAASIKESRQSKKQPAEDAAFLPSGAFPPIIDDGTKPGHSYAQLIGMAILRSPQRRLTLAQIYKWISDNFSFYSAQDAGWQNSIRHNLSLNKHFIKQERPKDDPGKGNYWAIEHGMEHLFMKEKPLRKSVTAADQPRPDLSQPPSLAPACQSSLPALPPPSSQGAPASLAAELSSDATIIVSDAAVPDETADNIESDMTQEAGPYSPLPITMHSSPPIPKHIDIQPGGTPPSMHRIHGSSVSKSRTHKRKFASMDDSGYISSLESSAMRPQRHARLPSDADRPSIKRGRAEEEIARLRASSYDSPSTGRSWNGYAPPSSSPLRQHSSNGRMLPPLTPATKLKAPPNPPPSVSPGTNLRLHREKVRSMIESPYKRVASMLPKGEAILQLTPGFNIDEVFYGVDRKGEDLAADGPDFDIFQDGSFAPMFALSPVAAVSSGSPVKRPAKKQRLDRSQSASALNEVTNLASSRSGLGPSPFLKVPGRNPVSSLSDTPSKVFDGLPSSPSKLFTMQSPCKAPATADAENIAPWISMDDLCSPEFLEDGDFSGIDMLAGFERIGSQAAQPQRQSRHSQRAGLGRSYTTTF